MRQITDVGPCWRLLHAPSAELLLAGVAECWPGCFWCQLLGLITAVHSHAACFVWVCAPSLSWSVPNMIQLTSNSDQIRLVSAVIRLRLLSGSAQITSLQRSSLAEIRLKQVCSPFSFWRVPLRGLRQHFFSGGYPPGGGL